MKLIILKEELIKALSVVNRFTTKSFTLPILNGVLLDAEKNFLKISATNLETGINFWILGQIEKEGKLVVQGKILQDIINFINTEKIVISGKERDLEIEAKNYKTKIKGLDPKDFPIIPSPKNKNFVLIKNKDLVEGIESVIENVSLSQTRPEISGVLFRVGGEVLKVVATDSFRLAEKRVNMENPRSIKKDFILPAKGARELIGVLGVTPGETRVYINENQVVFEGWLEGFDHQVFQVVSRLVEGEFPNYEKIIPSKFQTKIIIKKEVFLNEIKKASVFVNKINEVKLLVNSQKQVLKITSQNPDLGESVSRVPCRVEGEDLEISFNYRFLLAGLSRIKKPEVVFSFTNKEGPAILKPIGEDTFFYIVMPIKTS